MKVSAVIVTYNNIGMLEMLLSDLYQQTRPADRIIVVDNASVDNTKAVVMEWHPAVYYLGFEQNLGSAGGYHYGIKAAVEESDFVWTLDDDVRLKPDSLENLLTGFKELEAICRLGAVRSTGEMHSVSEPTRLDLFPWRGTLIKTSVIGEIGFPRKDYFLYGEDLEYALRFAKKGYLCFWIPASKCIEKRDDGKKICRIFGRQVKVYDSPFRLYYAFRNNVSIYREYGETKRLLRTLLYAGKLVCYFIMLSTSKGNRMRAISEGILDGFQGRLGKNNRYDPVPLYPEQHDSDGIGLPSK